MALLLNYEVFVSALWGVGIQGEKQIAEKYHHSHSPAAFLLPAEDFFLLTVNVLYLFYSFWWSGVKKNSCWGAIIVWISHTLEVCPFWL